MRAGVAGGGHLLRPLRDEEGAIRGLWCVAVDASSARVVAERHARSPARPPPPRRRGPHRAGLRAPGRGRGGPQCHQRLRRADGAWRWFLVGGETRRDEATGRVHVHGASTDIHDQTLAEEALRDANQSLERRFGQRSTELRLLANIVETTDLIIMAADPDLVLLGLNRAAADGLEAVHGAPRGWRCAPPGDGRWGGGVRRGGLVRRPPPRAAHL